MRHWSGACQHPYPPGLLLLLASTRAHAVYPQDTPKSPIRTAMAGVVLVHHAGYQFFWLDWLCMLNDFVFRILVVGMGMCSGTYTLNITINHVVSRHYN
jgi:hypothetical protein